MKVPKITLYQRGKCGVWWVRYSFNGERFHYSLGMVDERGAHKELTRIRYEIECSLHHPKKRMVFDNLLKEYLQWARNNKEGSSYERDLTSSKPLLAKFSRLRIDRMTQKLGEEYQSQRIDGKLRIDGVSRKPTVSKATVNREIVMLKHMFKKAVQWGYLSETPFSNLELQKEPAPRTRYVTADEWPRLLSACTAEMRSVVVFARFTGMREGEIFDLKWSDIDWQQESITVTKCKNNTPRTIPLTKALARQLRSRHQHAKSIYVFPGKKGRRTTLRTAFNGACRRAGIENFRFHDLRHTFASDLVNKGIDLMTIMKLMGHKSIQSTMRYAHLQKKRLREAMEQTSEPPGDDGPNLAQTDDGN
jgi:integrase